MAHEYFKVGTTQALINAVKARTVEKPDSDAFSPMFTAGAALGITGDGPTETAAWLQRTSTSDGPTTIRSIHGNTIVQDGELLPVNMTGIETEDANGDPLQTRSIPAGTLRGAGSVFDEQTETERITRIGEVDLGTLTWAYQTSTGLFYSGAYNSMKSNTVNGIAGNGYALVASTTTAQATDKSLAKDSNGRIYIHDSAYTDAAAFKTAMSGVMLHYELATPTTQTIDPPLNLTYRTETGGTERVMVPTGELSAPPTIVTAQGYTAESLRDAALATIAPVENGTASTNYAVGSYLVHGGQLCKVTTAIATGEAISIGTNVTTTTVMAEVLSLTQ